MITRQQFDQVVRELRRVGYGDDDIEWSEACAPPIDADAFAREAIFVICNSGMKNTVARLIFDRVMRSLELDKSAFDAFGHKKKAEAIDDIWLNRETLFRGYLKSVDKLSFLVSLPNIGPITKYHLAKNFGLQYAKPDVHLKRLADREHCTAQALCERLALETGYKIATVDVLLWRACAVGIINSRTGTFRGL